jgi:serine/threonine protein kinase
VPTAAYPLLTSRYKEIRFRSRVICAPATRIHNNRSVFCLQLPATPTLDRILSWTPLPIQSLLQRIFPEWFLPRIIILKEKTTKREKYFDNELEMYKRLQPLQGDCIPRLLGVATTNGWIPTLVLEYVDGTPLNKLKPGDARANTEDRTKTAAPQESPDNYAVIKLVLRQGLQHTFDLFRQMGVAHGDPELHNFIRVDDRVKAVDLEFAHNLGDGVDDETPEEEIVLANILSEILHC